MTGKNLYKEYKNARLTVKETNKVYNVLKYINNLTNQTEIKIPFKTELGDYKGDFIKAVDVKNMKKRLNDYITKNKKNPAYVSVIPPTTPVNTTATKKKGSIQTAFEKQLGSIKDEKEAIGKIRSLGYEYYLNTYKNNGSGKLSNLLNKLGKVSLNCVDYTCILANLFIEMGLTVQVVQIKCKTASHLLFRYKKKSTDSWIYVDVAAMADKNSSVCNIGKVCWCTNPNGKGIEILAVEPKWYHNMFLDDLLY